MGKNQAQTELLNRLFDRLYGSPLVRNDLRGELVEEMIAIALRPEWSLCGSDWGACDLIHTSGAFRMQVKQSAALQSWHADGFVSAPPRFSIAVKKGRWEGAVWINEPSRNADIFVFAWHAVTSDECDHRDASQWVFHVVLEQDLPSISSISLKVLRLLSPPGGIDDLRDCVGAIV